MAKITYLLGAGASAYKLPVVSNMGSRIRTIIDELRKIESIFYIGYFDDKYVNCKIPKKEYYFSLVSDLKWLQEHCDPSKSASIDTYAKKLIIQGKFKEYKRLKIALSVYFVLEQAYSGFDQRYDTFFASILDRSGALPDDLNVLSWNYDSQLEMAYAEYSGKHEIEENRKVLNFKSKLRRKRSTQGFSVIKLNGVCGFHGPEGTFEEEFLDHYKDDFNSELVERVLLQYAKAQSLGDIIPSISFAWESEKKVEDIMELIHNEVFNTEILVIIGYSFPFFNREIDKLILNTNKSLQKIYYQDLLANKLQSRIKAIRGDIVNIELVTEGGQFFLPYEL